MNIQLYFHSPLPDKFCASRSLLPNGCRQLIHPVINRSERESDCLNLVLKVASTSVCLWFISRRCQRLSLYIHVASNYKTIDE
jgi:hypothetical protein